MIEIQNRKTLQSKNNVCKRDLKIGDCAHSLSKNRNYWKSARAVRKKNYNNTPVVDGIHGNSEIANVFKSKFSALYSSVPTTTEAIGSLNENIDINVCNHYTDNANETDGHTHCHVIERNHVKSAIDKLKSIRLIKMDVYFLIALYMVLNCCLIMCVFYSMQ